MLDQGWQRDRKPCFGLGRLPPSVPRVRRQSAFALAAGVGGLPARVGPLGGGVVAGVLGRATAGLRLSDRVGRQDEVVRWAAAVHPHHLHLHQPRRRCWQGDCGDRTGWRQLHALEKSSPLRLLLVLVEPGGETKTKIEGFTLYC